MNARSIFDIKYSRQIRNYTHLQGWKGITSNKLLSVARNLYWFHKYEKSLNLSKLLQTNESDDEDMLTCFKQSIFTINGLLIKRFLCFPDLIGSYKEIAFQTAELFKELFIHYRLKPSEWEGHRRGPYLEIKEFLNHTKRYFHAEEAKVRHGLLIGFEFKYLSTQNFFPEMTELYTFILRQWNEREIDYTQTPAWFYRMSTFAQTRIIGYLPKCITYFKGQAYRDKLNRLPEKPNNLPMIRALVVEELTIKNVPRHLLASCNDFADYITTPNEVEQSEKFVGEVAGDIDFTVKQSASAEQTVREGGKLEDARRAINLLKDHEWKVPIRNLRTFEIIKWERCDKNDTTPDYHGLLFWFSLQLMINELIDRNIWKDKSHRHAFMMGNGGEWSPHNLWKAIIAIIKEPGKDRYLTMSSSFYNWSLVPGGKILNAILAKLPEHTVGLKGANDGWSYSQDIGPDSDNTGFIYNGDGSTKETFQYFQDWVEATDNINKFIGIIMLNALMDYGSFPESYGLLILKILGTPQEFEQRVKTDKGEYFTWTGHINNGFMMGNPITKTILHLCHVVDTAGTRHVLDEQETLSYPKTWQGPIPLLDRKFVKVPILQNM